MEDLTITSESPYLVTGSSSSDGSSREIAASILMPTITISGENVRLTNR